MLLRRLTAAERSLCNTRAAGACLGINEPLGRLNFLLSLELGPAPGQSRLNKPAHDPSDKDSEQRGKRRQPINSASLHDDAVHRDNVSGPDSRRKGVTGESLDMATAPRHLGPVTRALLPPSGAGSMHSTKRHEGCGSNDSVPS